MKLRNNHFLDGVYTSGPNGWYSYYQKVFPQGQPLPQPETVPMSSFVMGNLTNAQKMMRNEPYHGPIGDDWKADFSGDCLQKALAAQQYLMNAGIPAGALRLRLVKDEQGEPHMLLDVMTNDQNVKDGVYSLDGRATAVVPGNGLPYEDISREHPGMVLWDNLRR